MHKHQTLVTICIYPQHHTWPGWAYTHAVAPSRVASPWHVPCVLFVEFIFKQTARGTMKTKHKLYKNGTILQLLCKTSIESATKKNIYSRRITYFHASNHRKSRHIVVDQELLKTVNLGICSTVGDLWGVKKLPSSKITSLPSSLAHSISLLRPSSIHKICSLSVSHWPVKGPLKGVPSAHPCAWWYYHKISGKIFMYLQGV